MYIVHYVSQKPKSNRMDSR